MLRFALATVLAAFLMGAADQGPVKKIDRMFVVGGPIFDENTKPGVYVWLEDQYIQVAFVGQRTASVRFNGSKPFKNIEAGDFSVTRRGKDDMVWSARAKGTPARGRFRSPGNLKISEARFGRAGAPLYIGPLPRRGRSTVEIGRY